jgi:hypothetical protein
VSLDARLSKLMPALSARERATLILRSWKAKEREDPSLRATLPPSQLDEFNRLIGLMNGCNLYLGAAIMLMKLQVEKQEMRLVWLLSLRLWQLNLAELDYAAATLVREPITASEHARLLHHESQEFAPVAELAQLLAEEQRAWTDADLHEVPWLGELLVSQEAWSRLCAEAEKQLREAVKAGELEAHGRARRCASAVVPSTPGWAGPAARGPVGRTATRCGRTQSSVGWTLTGARWHCCVKG